MRETPALPTTTTLSGAASGSFGQSLAFSATVTASGGTPRGTVSFRRDGTEFATGVLNAQGVATASGSFPVGTHQITAVYLGAPGFAASASAPQTLTVGLPRNRRKPAKWHSLQAAGQSLA